LKVEIRVYARVWVSLDGVRVKAVRAKNPWVRVSVRVKMGLG